MCNQPQREASRYCALAIALLLIVFPLTAWGQKIHFPSFTVEDGLCQSQVGTITQDADGYLWLGTMHGVSRFDGTTFESFNRTLGLHANDVTVSHTDSRGRIWFGHSSGGLSVFDAGQFTAIPAQPEWEGSVVTAIVHDDFDQVWVGTAGGGLLIVPPDSPVTDIRQLQTNVSRIYALHDGASSIWVGSSEGLFVARQSHADAPVVLEPVIDSLLVESRIPTLHEDSHGRLWLGTSDEQLLVHIPAEVSASARDTTFELTTREGLPSVYFTDFNEDQQGNIWLATFGHGVWRLQASGDEATITDFQSYTMAEGLPYGVVMDVEVDREGVVWLGFDGSGVASYRGDAFEIYNDDHDPDVRNVWAILEDADGAVWFGNHVGLVRCTLPQERFQAPETRLFRLEEHLPSGVVRDLCEDDQGNLWLATEGGGLCHFDPRTGNVNSIGTDEGLPTDDLLSAVIEKDGTLWLGTSGEGVIHYRPPAAGVPGPDNPGEFEHYPLGPDSTGTDIWGMYVDRQGTVWAAITDIGLGRFVPPASGLGPGSFDIYGPEHGLQHLALDCITEDQGGRLWISADDGGLYSFDGARFTSIGDGSLISGEDVYVIGCDRDNNIVAGTNRGLYKYDQTSGEITRFSTREGFRNTETNVNAVCTDRSGALWIGTVGGALRYDPRGIRPILEAPRPRIANVSIFLKPVEMADGSIFEHDENHVTFELESISLADPAGLRYQYMLDGFDPDWITTTAERRFVTYSRLPFRHYTFLVRSANGDGLWNETPASFSFGVNAPFWRTRWFYALVVLVSTGTALGAFNWKTRSMARANRLLELSVRERTQELQQRSEELEEVNASLGEALEAAKQGSRAKATFLATMSHEIRTPLNGILGMTELLLDSPLDDGQQECAKTVSNSGKALLSILNDILDLSKIEAGRVTIDQAPLRCRDVVMDVVNLFTARLQEKSLDLAYCISSRVPEEVQGDPYRLRQVLANLIGNAIKFTDLGTVTLHIDTEETGVENRQRLRFEVRDTGIGISPEGQAKLFQPFSQVHSFDARRHSGTGLGLAICRELCQLMGGEIGVTAEIGRGSCFWFTLEVECSAATLPAQRLTGKRILIVDDNIEQRQVVAEQIEQLGAETSQCERSDQIPAVNERFDTILIDRENAMEDGLELVRRLHRDPVYADTQLILALPLGETLPREVHEELPRLTTVVKPIHVIPLEEMLHCPAESRPVRPADTMVSTASPVWEGVRVLVVDDNQINRMVAIRMLRKLGCHTESASDGLEAIDYVTRSKFDIIVMDCQMPVMDGFEATRTIRGIDDRRKIPIIALTANALHGDRERCLEAGMDDYLSKPVSSAKLQEMLSRWVERNPVPS